MLDNLSIPSNNYSFFKYTSQRPNYSTKIQPTDTKGIDGSNLNSNSSIQPKTSFIPSTEDMESALLFINSGLIDSSYPQNQEVSSSSNLQGALFNGLSIPKYNGTGELIADVSDREDSIENCPFEAYFA